jgi:hypothetical protein
MVQYGVKENKVAVNVLIVSELLTTAQLVHLQLNSHLHTEKLLPALHVMPSFCISVLFHLFVESLRNNNKNI